MLALQLKKVSKIGKPKGLEKSKGKRNHQNINAGKDCLSVFNMQIIAFKKNRKR